jgi:hypothetical protein
MHFVCLRSMWNACFVGCFGLFFDNAGMLIAHTLRFWSVLEAGDSGVCFWLTHHKRRRAPCESKLQLSCQTWTFRWRLRDGVWLWVGASEARQVCGREGGQLPSPVGPGVMQAPWKLVPTRSAQYQGLGSAWYISLQILEHIKKPHLLLTGNSMFMDLITKLQW